MRLTLR